MTRTECIDELTKEWNKLGNLFAEDNEWIEPDEAVRITQAHFKKFQMTNASGTVLMPPRVRHPGKEWILQEAKRQRESEPDKSAAPADASAGPLASVTEYSVRFRNGTFRLVGVDAEGAKISDCELPGPSSAEEELDYSIHVVDGHSYFAATADADYISCSDYTLTQMPSLRAKVPLPGWIYVCHTHTL